MTLFNYKATDQTGKIVTGTQDGSDERGVVASLQAQGYIPIRVTSTDRAPSQLSLRWNQSILSVLKKVSDKDILRFTEDLATLLGSGLTLDRSLQILRDASDKEALKSVLSEVLKAVQKGSYLSDALAGHPKEFSQFYVNITSLLS